MFEIIASWVTSNITTFGYAAVLILMALESCNIPIPSEVVLPFAGFLVFKGEMNFHLAALAGGLGCLVGSIPSYFIGKKLGRPFLEKYGKWFFISGKQLQLGDKWMMKYGNATSFFSRLLPVVRTFISFIAGIWNAPLLTFSILTFIGSWIWSYFLVYVGYKLGENWGILRPIWDKFHLAIIVFLICGFLYYIYHHTRGFKKHTINKPQ